MSVLIFGAKLARTFYNAHARVDWIRNANSERASSKMARYDEDLHENLFFNTLVSKYGILFSEAAENKYVVSEFLAANGLSGDWGVKNEERGRGDRTLERNCYFLQPGTQIPKISPLTPYRFLSPVRTLCHV